jgi:4-diphosphocytidyl-2-C-methyl-D-erythritol kinase
MVAFPPCKINLGLHILYKRTDGYHALETCFYPVPWTDILEVIPSDTLAFSQSGDAIPGDPHDNLCLRAYHLLQKDFTLPPVRIHLHKIIPTGAGLGGGSSDGAYTLRLLNDLFNLNLAPTALAAYAAQLGSDCAFFTQDTPQLGTGRGEILTPVDISLKGRFLVLAKPPIHVSTAEAYAGITPATPATGLTQILAQEPLAAWKEKLHNDFEASVFARHPPIQALKENLYRAGALYASMSGSGAAVFGIFDQGVDLAFDPGVAHWSGVLPR